jgi:mycofactocin precursor
MTSTELEQIETGAGIPGAEHAPDGVALDAAEGELLDELLVEEVSIDGMCGVY